MSRQTAIIIQHGDTEVLVRIIGEHVHEDVIAVDSRPTKTMRSESWYPIRREDVEVRWEGS